MSDVNPESFAEFATQDGPGSADAEEERAFNEQPPPEQEAHGGSMAPGLVDDTGARTAEDFPGERDL
ncbi:hypothetical protein [Actinoplanes sp. DH11]|uniref:hypothetical protein n=1 Tax=Actinoplanes sp. DH11 TaxID=2857011 RepID=UPI001E59E1D4|nr:hypothetical protein [Actinoplanes sp. DH11]